MKLDNRLKKAILYGYLIGKMGNFASIIHKYHKNITKLNQNIKSVRETTQNVINATA